MSRVGTVVPCEVRQKTPAKPSLAFVLLLVTCLPAVAQESFLSPRPAPVVAPAFAARPETPGSPVTSNLTLRQAPPPRIAPARTPRFSVRVEAPLRLQIPTYADRTSWSAAPDAWRH